MENINLSLKYYHAASKAELKNEDTHNYYLGEYFRSPLPHRSKTPQKSKNKMKIILSETEQNLKIDDLIADSKERTQKKEDSKNNILDVYKKNILWNKSKEEKLEVIKEKIYDQEKNTCSFTPNLAKSFSKSPMKLNYEKSTYNLFRLMPNQIPGLEDHYRRLKKAKVLMEDKEYLLNHPNCNWKSYYGDLVGKKMPSKLIVNEIRSKTDLKINETLKFHEINDPNDPPKTSENVKKKIKNSVSVMKMEIPEELRNQLLALKIETEKNIYNKQKKYLDTF